MKDALVIFGIALAVVIVGACIILARASARREKMWRDMIQRRVEDAEREEMFAIHPHREMISDIPIFQPEQEEPVGFMRNNLEDDDSTVTLPAIEEP